MKQYLVFFILSVLIHLLILQFVFSMPVQNNAQLNILLTPILREAVAPQKVKPENEAQKLPKTQENKQEKVEELKKELEPEKQPPEQEKIEKEVPPQPSEPSPPLKGSATLEKQTVESGKSAVDSSEHTSAFSLDNSGTGKQIGSGSGDSTGSSNSRGENSDLDSVYHKYQEEVRKKIESHREYPGLARRMGLEGIVRVQFVIEKDGHLKKVEVEKTSGSRFLDDAAKKAVEKSAPFPPFPSEIPESSLTFSLSFRFSLSS